MVAGRWARRLIALAVCSVLVPVVSATEGDAVGPLSVPVVGAVSSASSVDVPWQESEPNNTLETADPITMGGRLFAALGPSDDNADQDYYSFEAATPGIYTVEVFGTEWDQSVWVTVFDGDGVQLGRYRNNGSDNVVTRAPVTVSAAGTFYAMVEPYNGGWGHYYNIRVLPQWDQGLVHDARGEPNGAWQLAEPIGLGRESALIRDMAVWPFSKRDEDYYHFHAPMAGTYTIETFGAEASARTLRVETYDAAGQTLTPDRSGNGDLDVINRHSVSVASPGVYFFSVKSAQDVTYGRYSVRVLPQFDQGLTWDEAGEPNGWVHLAAPLRTGRWSTGEISLAPSGSFQGSWDQDFYHFAATAGQSYSIEVRGSESYPLRVLDRAGRQLLGAIGDPARATFTPAASGTYFLAVNQLMSPSVREGFYEMCVAPLGSPCTAPVTRLAGGDRYATSAQVSTRFPSEVPVVFLAAGGSFPDALSGSALASRLGGPVLLLPRSGVPAVVADELARLRPQRIVLLGGPSVISDETMEAVRGYATAGTAQAVTRIAGVDRYETSARVSAQFPAGVDVAYVATGLDFPDALSGAALAARTKAPILLTRPDALPTVIAAELQRLRPQRIVILGGEGVVSQQLAATLARYTTATTPDAVTRLAGPNRYATAAAVAARFPAGVSDAFVAVGTGFPDALAGAALAGRTGGPMLLVSADAVPASIDHELTRIAPAQITVLGGPGVVSVGVERALVGYVP